MQSSRPPSRVSNDLFRFAGLGTQFAATLGVFGALGWWLDTKLGSSPWLLLVGVFSGFGLGLYSMIQKLSPRSRPAPSAEPGRETRASELHANEPSDPRT